MFAEMNRPALISRAGSLPSVSLLYRPIGLSRSRRMVAQAMDFTAHRVLQIRAQQRNVYFRPGSIEPWVLSTPHSAENLDHAVAVMREALASAPGQR